MEILFERSKNIHMIKRYINFIESIANRNKIGHKHHILPKAKDMFPEYKNFDDYPWNGIVLSLREHFIAHWMLSKIFPGSSQSLAFYYMCNKTLNKNSKEYEKCKLIHIQNMKNIYTDERNNKISKALKGKSKSKEHKEKLIGHSVSIETREKLKKANLGKKRSQESINKQKESYKLNANNIDRSKCTLSEDSILKMSQTKKSKNMKWFNDGENSKLFSLNEEIPDGWSKGRIIKWKF